MKKLLNNPAFFFMYGAAIVLYLILQDKNPIDFWPKSIVYLVKMGLVIFLVGAPVAIGFELWGKIKRKLFEKRKK